MACSGGSVFGWRGVAVLVLLAAAGCGGGNARAEDGGAQGNAMIGDGGGGGPDDAGGTLSNTDAATHGASDSGPPLPVMLTVDAAHNAIVLDRCTGLTPAAFVDVAVGAHTIALTASTLSKGSVSDAKDNPLPSFDDYVIVHLPLAAGDDASRRLFMLNGIGDMTSFTLSAPGTVQLMFIDSDVTYNGGIGTVMLDATAPGTTVDGLANALAWKTGCASTPATLTISERPHRATLVDSTLSASGGSKDDFVLLRLPSERPMDPSRFVILNGVGANIDFTPHLDDSLRAWFITSAAGASGRATVVVTDL
jgi:hypothetical protein